MRAAETAAGALRILPMVAIVNAATSTEEHEKCMAAGMTATLAKPIKKDALLECVRHCIDGAAAAFAAAHALTAPGAAAAAMSGGAAVPVQGPFKILVAASDAGQVCVYIYTYVFIYTYVYLYIHVFSAHGRTHTHTVMRERCLYA